MDARFMLVLSAILATALAGPISERYRDDSTSCARTCTDTSKFNYVPGTTYEYEYNVQTKTAMEGADSNRATLGIRATAEIEVLSKCDLSLKLQDVKVYRSDPSTTQMVFADESGEFKRNLERFPLRFSFQDGVVEGLCPSDGESVWALNIKRGLLTAIQNSMDRLDGEQKVKETDVVGSCNTNYKVTSTGWYKVSIKKTKDILGCTDRHGYHSSIHATPYRVPSDIQSMPLIKSTHENEMELDNNGLLKNALVRETHTFRPFSQAENGATTNILQKLSYKTQRSGVSTRPGSINKRAGLTYEHVYGNGDRAEPRRDAEKKLEDICRDTREDIRPDTPRLFSELVYIMKNMDAASLRIVYDQLKKGAICSQNAERTKKFFIDAIPMASTTASVQFLTELLMTKEIIGNQVDMWITSLALIHYPTLDMIEQAKGLVETPEFNLKAMLPVSTMINNYCSHNTDCANEGTIANTLAVFEKNIGYGCYVRDNKLDVILMTLRALGNAGHSEGIVDSIRNCFTREGNPTEVRVAAIQAFRRLPCTADRNELFQIYRDGEEDSEIRISAYLSLMECPSEDVLSRIQVTLETEKANQVGSFVWSHLTNLMESSDPHKQTIRRILESADLKKEFDLEKLKYSRNYEGSLFVEKFNTGAMADSNLIFSETSFIPRSAMVNLTVDLFGNSINLLEIGGRIEGLEYLLETYLGPYGYFGDAKSKKTSQQNQANLDKMRGAIYMRMFGNEMVYKHFKGMESLNSASNFNYLEFLIQMSKKHDYSYTQSVMLMDSSMIIPTSSGLPLNLTVNGTATISFEASGQVDLRKVATKPRSLLIDGTIKPSGAIQIAGTMSMDAFVTKAGMRVLNTWHSSTALQGRVELDRGKVLSLNVDLPQRKMEIFDVRSEFFMVHGDMEKAEDLITDNRKSLKLCTGDRLAKLTGMELCNEFQWANASMKTESPYFPFTGPFSYSMTLIKRDTHNGYKLLAKKSETKTISGVQFSFDTPGSRVDRKVALDVTFNHKNKSAVVEVVSPWKTVAGKGALTNEKNLMAFDGNLQIDNKDEYGFTGKVKIAKAKDSVSYKPHFEIRRPRAKTITLSGTVNTQRMRRTSVDLSFNGATAKPITLKGSLQNSKIEQSVKAGLSLGQKKDYSIDASFINKNTGKKNPIYTMIPKLVVNTPDYELINFNGRSVYKPKKSLDGDLSLSVRKVLKKPLTANWKLAIQKGKYNGAIKVKSTYLTSKLTASMEMKKKNTVSSRLSIDYSVPAIRSIKGNKFEISSKYVDKSTKTTSKYFVNMNFAAKKNPDWNFMTSLDLLHNRRQSDANLQFNYGRGQKDTSKQMNVNANIDHDIGSKSNIKYDIKANLAPLNWSGQLQGRHKQDRKIVDSKMTLDYGKPKPITAELYLKDSSRKATKKMSGTFNLKSPLKDITLKTDLTPAKGDYTHKLTVIYGRSKSSAVTTYKRAKGTIHSVISDISLDSMNVSIQLKGKIDLNMKDFEVSGQVSHNKSDYSVGTSYKYSKDPKGKWALEVACPHQHVIVEVEGGLRGTAYTGSIETKWNADSKNPKKVTVSGELNLKSIQDIDSSIILKYPSRTLKFNANHKAGDGYTSHADFSWSSKKTISLDTTLKHSPARMTGEFEVKTPFRNYENILATASTENTKEEYTSNAVVQWGSQKKTVAGKITLKKPYTLDNLEVSISGSTPFYGYKRLSADLTHKLDSNRIRINLKGSMERKNAEVKIIAVNNGDSLSRNVEGNIAIKSNIRNLRDISLDIKHNDDRRKFVTDVIADINGDRYQYDLDMTHALSGWQYQNNGKLTLSAPNRKITNDWSHRNTEGNLETTFTSEWGPRKRIHVNVFGNHKSTARTETSAGLKLQTVWDPVRDINIDLSNILQRGAIKSSLQVKKDRRMLASINLNYRRSGASVESDFLIKTPFSEDIKGKLNSNYQAYPTTGHAELQWAPGKVVSADGSFKIMSSVMFESEARITTPFNNFENILLTGSNKYDNDAWISSALIDYAPRKTIKFDSRIATGSLKKIRITLTTPFEDFRRLDTGLNFDGGLMNFNSRADFTQKPHIGKYESVLNWNIARSDMTGKLRIDTPLENYKYVQILASSKKDDQDKRHSRLEAMYHPREALSLDMTYKLGTPFTIDLALQTPYQDYEDISASLKHEYRRRGIETSAEITYAPYKTVSGLLRLRWKNGIDGIVSVATPFNGYEKSEVSFRHSGELLDFKSHGEVEFASQKSEADVKFSHGDKTIGNIKLATPFSGFEKARLDIKRTGGLNNLKSEASVVYGKKQVIKIKFDNNLSGKGLDTLIQIQSPFTKMVKLVIDHNGSLKNLRTKVDGAIGTTHSFSSQTIFNLRKSTIDLDTSLALDWPYGEKKVAMSFHKEGELNDMNIRTTGEYNSQKVEITGVMKTKRGLEGSLDISTSFENFKNTGITVKHNGDSNMFNSEALIRYMDGQNIEGKLQFSHVGLKRITTNVELTTPFNRFESQSVTYRHDIRDSGLSSDGTISYDQNQKISSVISASISPKIELTATIKTPFESFEMNEAEISHEGPFDNCRSHIKFVVAGKTIVGNANFIHAQDTNGQVEIVTDMEGYERILIKGKREGSWRNLKAEGLISLRDQTVDASFEHRFTGQRLITAFTLKNPYTEDINFNIDHKMPKMPNFNTKVTANMGPDASLTINANLEVRNMAVNMGSDITYNIAGAGNRYSVKLSKDGDFEMMTTSLTASCGNKNIDVKGTFQMNDKVHGLITVNTPFQSFRNLQLVVDHFGTWNRFECEGSMTYMDGKTMSGKINHFHSNLRRIDSSIEARTPFAGFEFTKAAYEHTGDMNSLTCKAKLHYGSRKIISGELEASVSPKYEISLKTKTPFAGFRRMEASGSFQDMDRSYTLISEAIHEGRKIISINSNVDLSISPMKAFAQVNTPIKNFESNEITISHAGPFTNFRSTMNVQSPLISTISGEASLNYQSPFEMEALVQLSEDRKIEIENKILSNKPHSHIQVSWAPQKKVAFDGSYSFGFSEYEASLSADATVTTPFEKLRNGKVEFEMHKGSDRYTKKVEVDYNDRTVLDMDMTYNKGAKHEATLTIRQPRSMQYVISGDVGSRKVDTEVFANWNTDERESNVKFQTILNDRSDDYNMDRDISIKLIHPARTLGIEGSIAKSETKTTSGGKLIWNEDDGGMLSYDLDLNDQSRRYSKMYDGTFKLGTPLRSFKVDGSYSDARGNKVVDGTFFWDDSRDQTKQVGVKAVLSPVADNKKAELSLKFPAIGKDIKLDTEVTLNSGRTMLDAKTEFSYSSDYRKTVTFFSKMKDISGYSSKNYSMAVGISHPYTDVDVQLRSNIGKSDEKYTGIVDVLYLTARREKKNFALRGEINRIRNQLNLQVVSPVKSMSMTGEIESTNPYRLRLKSIYDNNRIINSEVSINTQKRSLDFQTNYDLDHPDNTINIHASYVNSSAVKAELYRSTNSDRVTESVIALRLNTSRILHTRIAWRPEVVGELQGYLTMKIRGYGQRTKTAFHRVYEAVGMELRGKYGRISQAASEELAPFVKLIESELQSIERQLDDLKRDIRRMYRRNDLFIADMGKTFTNAFEEYKKFVEETKDKFSDISESMSQYLDDMTKYPVMEKYHQLVAVCLRGIKKAIDEGVLSAIEIISKIDDQLQNIKESYEDQVQSIRDGIKDKIDSVLNHPRVLAMKSKLSDIDYQRYVNLVQHHIRSLNIPEKYNSVVYNAREAIGSNFQKILEHEDVQQMRALANNAYQEGVWAYNYWAVEDNLKKHLLSIYEIIKDLVEEEIQHYKEQVIFLEKSRITVWDPEHGEIQMELYLPIPFQSLDSLPEVDTSTLESISDSVSKYIPDRRTVKQYYDQYVPRLSWASENSTDPPKDQLQKDLDEYMSQPTKPRRMRQRYNARRI